MNTTGTYISDEQRLSGPFNFAAAPDAGGRFVGDYQGLTAVGSSFHPFFAITNCLLNCPANRTDIYTASVTPTSPTNTSSDAAPPGQHPGTLRPLLTPQRLAPIR